MAKINKIFVATSLILIFQLLELCSALPTSRNSDLIVGNDFLSIFLDQSQPNWQTNSSEIQSHKNLNFENENDSENYSENSFSNNDEILSQDTSNHYGKKLNGHTKSQKFIPKVRQSKTYDELNPFGSQTEVTNVPNDLIDINFEVDTDKDHEDKQVVKLVTSGSKIVFLDDTLLDDKNSTKEKTTKPKNKVSNSINLANKNNSDDVKVISVSVSSTIGRSRGRQKINSRQNNYNKSNKLVNQNNNNGNIFENDHNIKSGSTNNDINKSDFINRSHKSEFSIEESEPVTQQDKIFVDSVNGESTNIHSVLAPPVQTTQQKQQTITTINQSQHEMTNKIRNTINSTDKIRPTENESIIASSSSSSSSSSSLNRDIISDVLNSPNVAVSRMQRKQDKLVPFQTVIYHDSGYTKDGNTQPRSISYSSIGQTIDDLSTWKDIEGLLETKQNVSEIDEEDKSFKQQEAIYSQPAKFYSEPAKMYGEPSKFYSEPAKVYSEPAKVYGVPEKVYGQPAKVYSEPAKVYGEPSKVYSEPAKVYSEPSKIYWPKPTTTTKSPSISTTTTTTAPIHGRINTFGQKHPSPPQQFNNSRRIIFNLDKLPYDLLNAPEGSNKSLLPNTNSSTPTDRRSRPSLSNSNRNMQLSENPGNQNGNDYHRKRPNSGSKIISSFSLGSNSQTSPMSLNDYNSNRKDLVTDGPSQFSSSSSQRGRFKAGAFTENPEDQFTPTPEQNYEIEESVSVNSNGRVHNNYQTTPTSIGGISSTLPPADDAKVGYVVEGRNFRKYRVEEKTDDGFIVGEYGVVSHNDGGVRGVRYTADSNINPTLIHQALMKFLSL